MYFVRSSWNHGQLLLLDLAGPAGTLLQQPNDADLLGLDVEAVRLLAHVHVDAYLRQDLVQYHQAREMCDEEDICRVRSRRQGAHGVQ